jgi:voltage-gated potassium channel
VITLSTVGSREIHPITDLWYGKLFIVGLILSGMGVLFVFATSMTAFFVEGEIRHIFRRKKMDKALANITNHIIVCGAGDTGGFVIEELLRSRAGLVIVDTDEERIERIRETHPETFIPFVVGPGADDEVLQRAGIDRAQGVVIALPDERDNLFITVTVRQTNPKAKIVARAADVQAEQRLLRAGADAVVSPNRIGGMRMASEMVRPQVVTFLDQMLRGQEKRLRIEEIPLTASSPMVGKALRDTKLRQEQDLLVLAIRDKSGEKFLYNPPPDEILEEGSTLIVLGPVDSVHDVRNRVTS